MKTLKRVIIHGFNNEIITKLRESLEIIWIADDPRADIEYKDIRDAFSANCTVDFAEFDDVLKAIITKADNIYECYSRHHYPGSIDGSGLSIHDYSNLLVCHVVKFLNVIETFKPAAVISSNIPHEGYDNVLFELASIRNIKSVMFFQVPFSPKHWVISGPLSNAFQFRNQDFNNEKEIDDPDVDNYIRQLEGESVYPGMSDTSAGYVPKYDATYLTNILSGVIPNSENRDNFPRLVYRAIRKLVIDYKNYQLYKKYKKNVKSASAKYTTPAKFSGRYGYFALHLQPELTTAALGNFAYHNQLAALKVFSDFCAENDMVCLVKDNPKQNFSHRSKHFFRVLSSLDNVKLVDNAEDSLSLVRSAALVGTITGTVGLEAVFHGIPAVCFGDAWYGALEGVFKPSQLEASVLNTSINSDGNRQSLTRLNAIASKGVSDFDYLADWPLDTSVNNRDLVDSVLRSIG